MGFDPLTALVEMGKTALNKAFPDKISEEEKASISNNFELEMTKAVVTQSKDFTDFAVAYEGAAKDMPKIILYFRSLIRPVFTILIGVIDVVFFASDVVWDPNKVDLLMAINLVILIFWFGERAVMNSGVPDAISQLKGRK